MNSFWKNKPLFSSQWNVYGKQVFFFFKSKKRWLWPQVTPTKLSVAHPELFKCSVFQSSAAQTPFLYCSVIISRLIHVHQPDNKCSEVIFQMLSSEFFPMWLHHSTSIVFLTSLRLWLHCSVAFKWVLSSHWAAEHSLLIFPGVLGGLHTSLWPNAQLWLAEWILTFIATSQLKPQNMMFKVWDPRISFMCQSKNTCWQRW